MFKLYLTFLPSSASKLTQEITRHIVGTALHANHGHSELPSCRTWGGLSYSRSDKTYSGLYEDVSFAVKRKYHTQLLDVVRKYHTQLSDVVRKYHTQLSDVVRKYHTQLFQT